MIVRRLTAITMLTMLAVVAACSDNGPGAPIASIRFAGQPEASVAGESVPVSVELLDAEGARVTSARDEVTIHVGFGTNAHSPVKARASGGLATFNNVVVTEAGAQTLQATARGRSAVSLPFLVTAAEASGQTSVFEIPDGDLFSATPMSVNLRLKDEFGNAAARREVALNSTAGVTFTPSAGFTNDDGVLATTVLVDTPGSKTVTGTVAGRPVTFASPLETLDACTVVSMAVPGSSAGFLVSGTGCIVDALSTRRFGFTTTARAGARFTVNTEFPTLFEVRSDPAATGVAFFTDEAASGEWLLPAGTYEFLVSAAAGSGRFTADAVAGPGNEGQVNRILLLPGTYDGQSLGGSDFFDGDWYSDFFTVSSTAPCVIGMQSPQFDSFLILNNGLTGDVVGVANATGAGGAESISRPSCVSVGQPILINATTTGVGETGPYSLTLTFTGPATLRASNRAAPTGEAAPRTYIDARSLMLRNGATRRGR